MDNLNAHIQVKKQVCSEQKELPVNPIGMNLKAMIRLKKLLPNDIFRKLIDVLNVDMRPNILMGAMEFGTIYIKGEPITAKVGGLAVVINDMINNLPKYIKGRSKGKVSFTFMAYDGIPKCAYVKSFDIEMAHRTETVDIFKYNHEMGATLYFIDHPLFKRRTLRDPSRNIYSPYDGELYSGKHEFEEAFTYALFNKAIAKLGEFLNINIYHGHDFHTALASAYMDKDIVTSLTIHNAGPGYQGKYWVHEFGGNRIPHPDYPFGVPTGDFEANNYLLRILGIDFDTYMRVFEDNGQFNTLKVMKLIEKNNLVAGSPVSSGYAGELARSYDQLIGEIWNQKGNGPHDSNQVYVPNDHREMGLLKGIENGLSSKVHAANHPFLKKKTELECAKIHGLITDLNDRKEWLKGLNFGKDLLTPMGIKQVHNTKAKLKEMLQRNAKIEVNPDRPLFVTISRLVSQKNIHIFAENIMHIVSRGGQVIIGGKPGDEEGTHVAELIHQIENCDMCRGQVRFFNEFINNEMAALIQAGGDFFVITSKFEPCGLTDIEATWLGTIPVCRKTGGLSKVKNGLYYEWADSSDQLGEIYSLRSTLDYACDVYYTDKEKFRNMRIEGMKEDFSWNVAFSKYFENYRTSSIFKLMVTLQEKIYAQNINAYVARDTMKNIFRLLPIDLVTKYQETLREKQNLTHFELLIANYNFYEEYVQKNSTEITPSKKIIEVNNLITA